MLFLLKSKIVYRFLPKNEIVIRIYFELPQQCSGTVVRYFIRINPALHYLHTAIVP